jgi:hypothetical protein
MVVAAITGGREISGDLRLLSESFSMRSRLPNGLLFARLGSGVSVLTWSVAGACGLQSLGLVVGGVGSLIVVGIVAAIGCRQLVDLGSGSTRVAEVDPVVGEAVWLGAWLAAGWSLSVSRLPMTYLVWLGLLLREERYCRQLRRKRFSSVVLAASPPSAKYRLKGWQR